MNINDWTLAINYWLSCLASTTGKPERVQAALSSEKWQCMKCHKRYALPANPFQQS